MAIIAALPFTAMAENISGAMYNAPAHADNNHPAPTTNAGAPYGRIDIDTADQEHIATTAYVKGAYNSAIAAVNNVNDDKQVKLLNDNDDSILPDVLNNGGWSLRGRVSEIMAGTASSYYGDFDLGRTLMTADEIAFGVAGVVQSQRVEIYTTWDDDDVAEVPLVTASGQ